MVHLRCIPSPGRDTRPPAEQRPPSSCTPQGSPDGGRNSSGGHTDTSEGLQQLEFTCKVSSGGKRGTLSRPAAGRGRSNPNPYLGPQIPQQSWHLAGGGGRAAGLGGRGANTVRGGAGGEAEGAVPGRNPDPPAAAPSQQREPGAQPSPRGAIWRPPGQEEQPDRGTGPVPARCPQHPAPSWCSSREPCLAICSACCFNYPARSRGLLSPWERHEGPAGGARPRRGCQKPEQGGRV